METKSKNISLKAILIAMTIGIWAIVLQNAGIIPTNQNVRVVNEVDAYVRGSVNIDNTVDVRGYVDVNIQAINGYSRFYDNSSNRGKYFRLPVYTGGN
jgi:hypothetical protein